jgi:hypothetical protein
MAHDQEVVGLNPGTIYWMDASNLLAITLKKTENKGSQMGQTKKYFKKIFINNVPLYSVCMKQFTIQLISYLERRVSIIALKLNAVHGSIITVFTPSFNLLKTGITVKTIYDFFRSVKKLF